MSAAAPGRWVELAAARGAAGGAAAGTVTPEQVAGRLLRETPPPPPFDARARARVGERLGRRSARPGARRLPWLAGATGVVAMLALVASQREGAWRETGPVAVPLLEAPVTPARAQPARAVAAAAVRPPTQEPGLQLAWRWPPLPRKAGQDLELPRAAPRMETSGRVLAPGSDAFGRWQSSGRFALDPPRLAVPQRGAPPRKVLADPLELASQRLATALLKLRRQRDPAGALAVLDDPVLRQAGQALAPEVRVARIEALLALGRHAEALSTLESLPEAHLAARVDLRASRDQLRRRRAAASTPDRPVLRLMNP
jgi:hypothetical protein